MSDSPVKLLLTVKEVASLIGCSQRHVYRCSDDGKIPKPIKVGALVRWRVSDIEKWVSGEWKPEEEIK